VQGRAVTAGVLHGWSDLVEANGLVTPVRRAFEERPQSITFHGVNSAALTASNFEFDLTPVMNNTGI
jgi:hypothetical protein